MSKIEEYTYMISTMYDSLQNTKEKLADKLIKLQKLTSELKYAKYQNNTLLTSEIIKKIDVVLSDGLNIVRNMVCKQNRKITIKKQKDISGYLRELRKIANEKTTLLEIIMHKMES